MVYLVRNARTAAVLGEQIAVADRWAARLKGLLGRDGLAAGEGLHIVPCNSIHMFFMRFPIDVAFLDAEGKVVRAVHSIRPWRATRVFFDAHSALELPAGTLARSDTREGDLLRFEPGPGCGQGATGTPGA